MKSEILPGGTVSPRASAGTGVHIHVDNDRIIIEGMVGSAEREPLLAACRRVYADRKVIDRLAIEEPPV